MPKIQLAGHFPKLTMKRNGNPTVAENVSFYDVAGPNYVSTNFISLLRLVKVAMAKFFLPESRKLERFEERLQSHSMASSSDLLPGLQSLQEKLFLQQQIQIAKREARAASNIILLDELKHRERLLHKLE